MREMEGGMGEMEDWVDVVDDAAAAACLSPDQMSDD